MPFEKRRGEVDQMIARRKRGSGWWRGPVGKRRVTGVKSIAVESEGAELELVSVEELGAGLGSESSGTGKELGGNR